MQSLFRYLRAHPVKISQKPKQSEAENKAPFVRRRGFEAPFRTSRSLSDFSNNIQGRVLTKMTRGKLKLKKEKRKIEKRMERKVDFTNEFSPLTFSCDSVVYFAAQRVDAIT